MKSSHLGRRAHRRTALLPSVEGLEERSLLHAAAISAAAHQALLDRLGLATISGQVAFDGIGRGVRGVRIQLIDTLGRVVGTTATNSWGQYRFLVHQDHPYVVRQVVPRGFSQTAPTFVSTAPVGALIPGAGNHSWNYTSPNVDPTKGVVGPAGWSNISEAGAQPFESPINLTGPTIDLSQVLTVHYAAAVPTQIINNGYEIQTQFNPSAADSISYGGQTANLLQFHFHDPAETLVNGKAYTMEEHLVNVTSSGAISVVGVFLQLGAHNDALDPILNAALSGLTKPNTTTTISTAINLAGLLPTNTQGWFYQGSLTTPPIAQPINWFVYATPITLDAAQLAEYEQVASGSGFLPNARPVQPTDGRILNEINFNVNVQNQSIAGLNFGLTFTGQPKAKLASLLTA